MLRAAFGLLASILCLGLTACGSDDTGDGATTAASTSGAGATGGGGSGSGATGVGGMTASASTGAGGATGGAGGAAAAPTVELTVNPTTIKAGGTTEATVMVTNFILEKPVGQPNEDGHGHYHIYLDNASGGSYLIADQAPMVAVKIPAATQPGAHKLRVSVSDNGHAPLVPAIEDIVDITVE